jgi:hypothetical protein
MIMIYPILWILKNERQPKKAASALERFVFEPFHKYIGNKGKTPLLCLYIPLEALFNILMYIEGEIDAIDDSLIPWALEEGNLTFSSSIDNAMANFGRCGSSIGAEVCLLLSKFTRDQDSRRKLIEKGWGLVEKALELAEKCGRHQTCYFETKPVYDAIFERYQTYQTETNLSIDES